MYVSSAVSHWMVLLKASFSNIITLRSAIEYQTLYIKRKLVPAAVYFCQQDFGKAAVVGNNVEIIS